MRNQLSESLENYLEAIYEICCEKPAARPKDVAEAMQVSNPSVTGALKALTERQLIDYTPFGLITLTDRGQTMARGVSRRHRLLSEFLVDILGIECKEADEAACRMEHGISPAILERLSKLVSELKASDGKTIAFPISPSQSGLEHDKGECQ
jgi:DtxR family Mn-dependent transcriptional regulator